MHSLKDIKFYKEIKSSSTIETYFIIENDGSYESLRKIYSQISNRRDEDGDFTAVVFDPEDPSLFFYVNKNEKADLHKCVESYIEAQGIIVSSQLY